MQTVAGKLAGILPLEAALCQVLFRVQLKPKKTSAPVFEKEQKRLAVHNSEASAFTCG
jgi:hypothetical protein